MYSVSYKSCCWRLSQNLSYGSCAQHSTIGPNIIASRLVIKHFFIIYYGVCGWRHAAVCFYGAKIRIFLNAIHIEFMCGMHYFI